MWHAAHNGGEHQSSDEGEEHQVYETFDTIVTEPGQRLDIVLHGGNEQRSELCKKVLD